MIFLERDKVKRGNRNTPFSFISLIFFSSSQCLSNFTQHFLMTSCTVRISHRLLSHGIIYVN